MNKEVPGDHDPTVEDTYSPSIEINGSETVIGMFCLAKLSNHIY